MLLKNFVLATVFGSGPNGQIGIKLTENPNVPSKDGKPIFSPRQYKLMSVKEVSRYKNIGITAARKLRREQPAECLLPLS